MKKEDNEIREAVDVLYKISGNKEVIQLADLREKAIKDEISRLKGAKDEGRAMGKAEAAIENAMNLLNLGVDIEIVAKGTGLTVNKVTELFEMIKK